MSASHHVGAGTARDPVIRCLSGIAVACDAGTCGYGNSVVISSTSLRDCAGSTFG